MATIWGIGLLLVFLASAFGQMQIQEQEMRDMGNSRQQPQGVQQPVLDPSLQEFGSPGYVQHQLEGCPLPPPVCPNGATPTCEMAVNNVPVYYCRTSQIPSGNGQGFFQSQQQAQSSYIPGPESALASAGSGVSPKLSATEA